MKPEDDVFSINEKEVMDYYGFVGGVGKLKMKSKFTRGWILHSLAYSSPHSGFAIKMQKIRGVEIGENCHFSPYVLIDLIYPGMIHIGNNVTIGSNTMIFAHYNPTANAFLKENGYPREVKDVTINDGAVIGPGSIITMGTTIGKNSIIGAGSVISGTIPDHSVAIGNPGRVIKKINL